MFLRNRFSKILKQLLPRFGESTFSSACRTSFLNSWFSGCGLRPLFWCPSKRFLLPRAAVVGIGLLSGSLLLHAEDKVGTEFWGDNPPLASVCAPPVAAIWITQSRSNKFTVAGTRSDSFFRQVRISLRP